MQGTLVSQVQGVAAQLESHYAVFRYEIDALSRQDFQVWPDTGAYSGGWLVCPFFLRTHPGGVDPSRGERLAPRSSAILRGMEGVRNASFSRITPGTHIYRHKDLPRPGTLRLHLGLRVPDGALMDVDGEIVRWVEGGVTVIDGQIPHEVANLSDAPRDILIVDALID